MRLRSLTAASAIAMFTFATQAHAIETWTLTVQGVITWGIDNDHLFGDKALLEGMTYTQSITASVDPSAYNEIKYFDSQTSWLFGSGQIAPLTTTVVVNGRSYTYESVDTVEAEQTAWYGPNYAKVSSTFFGSTADGRTLGSTISIYNPTSAFTNSGSFHQTLSLTIGSDYQAGATFGIHDNHTMFSGTVTSFTLTSVSTGGTSPVPEPASYATLLAGLGLLGAARGRKRFLLSQG